MEELKKLYDVLVREGKYTKSFEEFQTKWTDPTYKDQVYDVVSRDGLYTKDKNEFLTKYSSNAQEVVTEPLKKKEQTQLPTQGNVSGTMGLPSESTSSGSLKPFDKNALLTKGLKETTIATPLESAPQNRKETEDNANFRTPTNLTSLQAINNFAQEKVKAEKEKLDLRNQIFTYQTLNPETKGGGYAALENILLDPNESEEKKLAAQKQKETVDKYFQLSEKTKALNARIDKDEATRQKGLDERYGSYRNTTESFKSYGIKGVTGFMGMMNAIGGQEDEFNYDKFKSILNSYAIESSIMLSPEEKEKLRKDNEYDDDGSLDEEVRTQKREKLAVINKFADSLITQETPKNWQKLFEGEWSANRVGYVMSQAFGQVLPTVAAGFLGGPVTAGAVGAGMAYNESFDMFEKAGLKTRQSELAATALAIPLGVLDAMGVSDIVTKPAFKLLLKETTKDVISKLATKELTEASLFSYVKATMGQKIKEYGKDLVMSGVKEPLTEMEQALLSEAAGQTAEAYTGKDSNKEQTMAQYLKELGLKVSEEGFYGLVGGIGTSAVTSAVQNRANPTAYGRALELKDDALMSEFKKQLDREVKKGIITQEQAVTAVENVHKIQAADNQIPSTIEGNERRSMTATLIQIKQALKNEIEGKDKSLTGPTQAAIDDIDIKLNEIATGQDTKTEQVAPKGEGILANPETTTVALEALPLEEKTTATFKDINGDTVSILGNEKKLSDLFHEAQSTPEDNRTEFQQSIIDTVEVSLKTPLDLETEVSRLEAEFGLDKQTITEADTAVSQLSDNEQVTETVTSLDDVPVQFRDRVTVNQTEGTPKRKQFFGIKYGKEIKGQTKETYTYTATGKEIKSAYAATKQQVGAAPTTDTGVSATNKSSLDTLKAKTTDVMKIKVVNSAEKAVKTLKSILPNFDMIVHEDEGSYNAAVQKEQGTLGTSGNFSVRRNAEGKIVGGRIDINLSKATSTTVAHEVAHSVLLNAFGDNPALFKTFRDNISKILKADTNKKLTEFADQYKGEVKHEEFLVQLTALMEQEQENISATTYQKVAALINKLVSTLTAGQVKVFEDIKNTKDLIDFLNTTAKSIRGGEELNVDGITAEINPNATPNETDVDISSITSKSSLIQNLGLTRFPQMKNRIQTGFELSQLGNITSHLTFADRLVTGKVDKKDYLGGILFAAATGRVWASFNLAKVNTIIKGMTMNKDGYRYLMPAILTKEAHMSNNNMLIISLKLVEDAIINKTISTEDANKRIKKALSKKDLKDIGDKYDEIIKGKEITTQLLKDAIENIILNEGSSTFDQRKSFLETLLGKADIDKSLRFGDLPSFSELAVGLAEPITSGHKFGDIILVIRTKGNLVAVKPEKTDDDYHPSYPWVIRSLNPDGSIADVETLIFKKSYNAVDVFPEVTNSKGVKLSYEQYKEKYKEGAKSRYLNYMGAAAAMSTNVSQPINVNAQGEKEISKKEINNKKTNKDKVTSKSQINGKEKNEGRGNEPIKTNDGKVRYKGKDAIGERGRRNESEKDVSRAEAKEKIILKGKNVSLNTANQYNKKAGLPKIVAHKFKPSNKEEQTKIGKIYQELQDVTSPTYKETELERQVFNGYNSKYPNLIKKYGIKNYKDLVEKSYKELGKEVNAQFNLLPIKVDFHTGEKNYENSVEMLDDVHNFGHLWVFKGGDEHPITGSKTIDNNGLTINDKFRAVHDYFGHSVNGYEFGKNGEENAWIEHSKMFSPLAQLALSSETRGQNSVVNYSGINDIPLEKMKDSAKLLKKGLAENNSEMIADSKLLLEEANNEFQFADQKAIILPEEYVNARKYFKKQSTNQISLEVKELEQSFPISKSQVDNEKTIDRMVRDARGQGFSEEAIAIFLERNGFTAQEIEAVMDTELGASKQMVLSEETMPGFDKMMAAINKAIKKDKALTTVPNKDILSRIMKYLAKQDTYKNATDIQREKLVRDINKIIGIREKAVKNLSTTLEQFERYEKAFGIDVTLGNIVDPNNITMTEKELLIKQIKDYARGARDVKAAWVKASAELTKDIKNMMKTGKISVKQAASIVRRFGAVNVFSEKSIGKFVDYMTKVFNDAEYVNQLSIAQKTKKAIASLSKNQDRNANLKELGKKFTEIDPSMVDDIYKYNTVAAAIYEAIYGSKLTSQGPKFAQTINIESVSKYVDEMVESQNKKLLDEKIAEIQELMGVDASKFTPQEIKALLENTQTIKKSNEVAIKDSIKNMFGIYSTLIKETISRGTDLFTGEPRNFTKQQKELIGRFMAMDLNNLNAKQSLAAVDSLINFFQNDSTAKMEAVLSDYAAMENTKILIDKNIKSLRLNKWFSDDFGKFLAEQTYNLPMVFERMFKGVGRGAYVQKMSGLTKLINKKSLAVSESNIITENYVNQFYKQKANGEAFNTSENNVERGIAAFMMRTFVGSEEKMQTEFNRRKGLVEETIDVLSKGNDEEQKKAELYTKVYEKFKKAENIQDVMDATDKVNLEAIQFWQNAWGDKFDKLADVSLNVYNKVLNKELNYIPDNLRKLTSNSKTTDLQKTAAMNESSFHHNNNSLYDTEAGVLQTPSYPTELPTDDKNNRTNRVVDFSFDSNNANSMYDALVDVNTASAVRQVDTFINGDDFNKIFNIEDGEMLKDRIEGYVRNIRSRNIYSQDEFSKFAKALNKVAAIGVGQALGGPTQTLKQVIPVAFNTLVNAQDLDISSSLNSDFQTWLAESGYAIGSRGVKSQADIESLNKLIKEDAKNGGKKALDLVLKVNEWWLQTFLVSPDVYIAKASWKSYYEKSLRQQGIDTKNLDYSSHSLNEDAADYAQRMVDRQQNVSDADLNGLLFTDKEASRQILVKIFMPFANFRMNQAARLGSDINVLTSKTSTVEDRRTAALSLSGFAVEMAVFKMLSGGLVYLFGSLTKWLMDDDENKEERKKRRESIIKGQATSAVVDILSPAPILDPILQYGAAYALAQTQRMLKTKEKDVVALYEPKAKTIAEQYGLFGIPLIRIAQLSEMTMLAYNGIYKDDYGRERKISKNDQELIGNMIPLALLTNIGLAPVEVNTVMRNTIKFAKKGSKTTESIEEEESNDYGIYDTKEDLKRYDPILYEEKFGKNSENYLENEEERKAKKEERDLKRAEKDAEYGYIPKEKPY